MWQRTEIEELKTRGYIIDDPWDAIKLFEDKVAKYTGAKHAIAVDSCSSALFLSMKYCNVVEINIPNRTYISVPMMAKMHSSTCKVNFCDTAWKKWYSLTPVSDNDLDIIDCAVTLEENMYQRNSLQCISFQHRKPLKIGKGGIILTDSKDASDWLRKASYDGRDRTKLFKDDAIDMIGYHMYMAPEDGARGVLLFDEYTAQRNEIGSIDYPNISKFNAFKDF